MFFLRFIAVFTLFFVVSSMLQASPKFEIQELGSFGGVDSFAYGINDVGEVVGRYGRQAFYWRNGDVIDIEKWAQTPAYYSYGLAINNSGLVVGARRSNSHLHGFYADAYDRSHYSIYGRSFAEIKDINNFGKALAIVDSKVYVKDLISNSETIFNIRFAKAINDQGVVVGRDEIFNGISTRKFGDLGVKNSTFANDLNNQNQVVGYSYYKRGYQQAFIWSSAEGISALDSLGGPISAANSINDDGWVVGWSAAEKGNYRAVLWSASGDVIDLTKSVINLTGWRSLIEARDINRIGQIVGIGVAESGEKKAFLLTPVD